MKHLFNENYLAYKLKSSDLYVAIGQSYQRDIRQYAMEYQSLNAVPDYKTVKGIIFRIINNRFYELMNDGRETEFQVNCLEPETGDFRLSA